MDVTTFNITPFTSNLEDQDPPFVGPMGTCPMFRDVDVRDGIVLINVNDWGRHIWHLASPFWRSSSSSFPCGFKECELEHVTTIDESTSSGSKKKQWLPPQKMCIMGYISGTNKSYFTKESQLGSNLKYVGALVELCATTFQFLTCHVAVQYFQPNK